MYPKNHEKRAPAAATVLPSIFRFFKITSIFDAIFDLSYLHFGTKNRSWGVLGRLGSVLGRLGSVLAASWAVLGASWRVLGASCGVLLRLGGVLGASWSVLERKTTSKKPGLAMNGKRVFIHLRLHFSDICCFFQHWQTVRILARVYSFTLRSLRSLRSLARCACTTVICFIRVRLLPVRMLSFS